MNRKIIIGSRESRLAVIQAELVRAALLRGDPSLTVELRTWKTTGDVILDRTLLQEGGKGLFTKELESALLAGEADVLVHSLKDVPMALDPRIPLAGFTKREDERDALVLPEGRAEPAPGLPIGSSSLRRTVQLAALYPGFLFRPVRGNVLTRLKKLDEGQYGALCLAAAGLRRLGLADRISRYFSPDELVPAAGQGILALQTRRDFDPALLAPALDPDARDMALAERAFVRALDGGCSSPTAAHAVLTGDALTLTGLYLSPGETVPRRGSLKGARADAEALGALLAERLLKGESL